MQSSHDIAVAVPRSWPVMAALGMVALLLAATIAVDLVAARRVAQRTTEIVENSQPRKNELSGTRHTL